MNTLVRILLCSIFPMLLVGCSAYWVSRPIVRVAATGDAPKLDYRQMESFFYEVSGMLAATGFNGSGEKQPSGYYLTGEPTYGDGFQWDGTVSCTVNIDRKSVTVSFVESELARNSGVFSATEEQRRAVLVLAQKIERHLRRHLPSSYKIRISTDI